jgi:hypothetical protein
MLTLRAVLFVFWPRPRAQRYGVGRDDDPASPETLDARIPLSGHATMHEHALPRDRQLAHYRVNSANTIAGR